MEKLVEEETIVKPVEESTTVELETPMEESVGRKPTVEPAEWMTMEESRWDGGPWWSPLDP